MKTDHRRNPAAEATAPTHCLPRRREGYQLESAAEQALGCLAALTGMLSRLKELAESHEPEGAAAAAYTAPPRRAGARALLRSLDALGKRPAEVPASRP
jgi:hypothetical protein